MLIDFSISYTALNLIKLYHLIAAMIQRLSKLSLKKQTKSDMNTLDLTDNPPTNQEANNQIIDLDLTISLSDGIGTTCTENNDYAYGIKLISETMNEWLDPRT